MEVVVLDAAGHGVCNAIVTAADGDHSEVLRATEPCRYTGAVERTGTYAVEAVLPSGSRQTAPGVRVTRDGCHVTTTRVTLRLTFIVTGITAT